MKTTAEISNKDALQKALDSKKPTSEQLAVPSLDLECDTDASPLEINNDDFEGEYDFDEPADDGDDLSFNGFDNPPIDSDSDTLMSTNKASDFSDFVVDGSDIKFYDKDLESLITKKNITDFHDYIFAYQDSNASDIRITHAHHNDHEAVADLLSTACSFLEKHAHCTDIRAKWYKSEARAKTYVKAITAIFDLGEPKVIAISSPKYFFPISDLNLELPSHPINTIADLELAIEGLLLLGKLSMANNQLTLSGQTHQDAPRLLIATLSPELPSSSDYEYRISSKTGEKYLSHGSNVDPLDRHIVSAVGNDPIHMNLSSDALFPFDMSIAALKRRITKTNKQIKTSSPKSHELLPAMPIPSQDKRWLVNTIFPPYDMIWLGSPRDELLSKSNVLKNSRPSSSFGRDIQNSLLFSNEFLEAFLAISPRIFDLFINPITPTEDEYDLLLNDFDAQADPIFGFDKSFLLSLGDKGRAKPLEGMPSIRDLIAKGASSQELNGCVWNDETRYFHFAKGARDGVVSYWLYWLMVDVYFGFKQTKNIYIETQEEQCSFPPNFNESLPAITTPETGEDEDSDYVLGDDSDCAIDEYFGFEEPTNPDDLLDNDDSTSNTNTIEAGAGRHDGEHQSDSDLAIKSTPELVDDVDCDLESHSTPEVLPITNNTISSHDYILAYQDSNSLNISTVCAQRTDQNGIKNLLSAACGFLEKNLSCTDIRAKWHKAQSGTKTYVKILTARLGSDEVKVIAVTAPQYFSLKSLPDLESPAYPINTIDDLEAVIDGLIVLGYLSFDDEQLAAKNHALRDMPKILVATLSTDQPDDAEHHIPHSDKVDSFNNRITKVVSNDSIHITLSDMRLSEYTTSLSAIKTRLAKANAQIKKASPNSYELLPELATPTKDKMWLLNMQPCLLSRANLSYHGKVALRLDKSMPHSLLFSSQFLEAFLSISPRCLDLWLEAVDDHEDSYCVLINNHPSALYSFLGDDLPFRLSLGQPDWIRSEDWIRPVTAMPDIRGLITKGLSLQELASDDWDDKNQRFNFTNGNLDGIVSYWLYWLITNTYFVFEPLRSKIIEDVSLLPSDTQEQSLLVHPSDTPCSQSDIDLEIGHNDDFDFLLDSADNFEEPANPDDLLDDDDSTSNTNTIEAGAGRHDAEQPSKPKFDLVVDPSPIPEPELADDSELEVLVTADNITDFHDYILVYQDSNTLDINIAHASNLDQSSVDHLISTATNFLKSTIGCTDIRSKWYKTHSSANSVTRSQIITACIGSENPEIIAITKPEHSMLAETDFDQPSQPISNVVELEAVIAGLVLLGYLSADADYLAADNKTLHDIPKILIATLSPKSPLLPYKAYPTYASSQAPINPEDKYIISVVSNDPVHMEISRTSSKGCCASVTAIETRLKNARSEAKTDADRNNTPSPKFPRIAEPLQGKVWLLETSGTLITKKALTRKINAPQAQKEIQSSLLLSSEFLEAFLWVSNRSIDLVLRAISGSKDSCYVAVANELALGVNDTVALLAPSVFLPDTLFTLALTRLQPIRHNIRGLIAKGWYSHSFDSSDWQSDGYRGHLGYFDNVTGTTHGRISHWVYWLIVNTYFSLDVIPPMLIRPNAMLSTPTIEQTGFLRATNQENVLSLDIGGLSFVVGNVLFDLSYNLKGLAYTCSIFKSPPSAGLIAAEDTFTGIYLREGKVFHVHSANTLPEIFTILLDTLLSSDEAYIFRFDVFDIMREIVDVAKQMGVKLSPLLSTSVLAV